MEPIESRLSRILILGVALACAAIPSSGDVAGAAPSSGAGYDYQSGPEGRTWKGALGFVAGRAFGADFTLAAVRYDDSNVGLGISGVANAGFPLLPRVRLRLIGVRSVGDGSYRSSRLRAGPELALAGGRTLGIYFAHFEDNASSRLNALGSEIAIPVVPTLTGSGGVSYGEWRNGLNSLQGTAGLVWNPSARIQLLGELAVGRNVFMVWESSSARGGLGHLPILGGIGAGNSPSDPTTSQVSKIAATGLLGFRILIP